MRAEAPCHAYEPKRPVYIMSLKHAQCVFFVHRYEATLVLAACYNFVSPVIMMDLPQRLAEDGWFGKQ